MALQGSRILGKNAHDYALQPPKPVIDGEPLCGDHPLNFNSKLNGYSFDVMSGSIFIGTFSPAPAAAHRQSRCLADVRSRRDRSTGL